MSAGRKTPFRMDGWLMLRYTKELVDDVIFRSRRLLIISRVFTTNLAVTEGSGRLIEGMQRFDRIKCTEHIMSKLSRLDVETINRFESTTVRRI